MTDQEVIKALFPDKGVSQNVADLALRAFRLGEQHSYEIARLREIIERAKNLQTLIVSECGLNKSMFYAIMKSELDKILSEAEEQ